MTPDKDQLRDWFVDHNPLWVAEWNDPVIKAAGGYDPDALYVELFWLPVLGPTALWLLRRLALYGDRMVVLEDVAGELGIGGDVKRNSQVVKSLARLVQLQVARIVGDRIEVMYLLPPVPRRRLRTCAPQHVQAMHDQMIGVAS